VDFCLRIRESGLRIRYEPTALAVHEGGHSVRSVDWGKRQVYWNENQLRYSGLHFTPPGQVVTALSVAAGGAVRGMWEALRRGSLGPLRAAGLILRAAAAALWVAVRSASREELKGTREGNSERG
jgi:GT2 family glycosyltransferase